MNADEHAVLGDGEILLDEVRALLDRQPVGRERVLRRVGGCAAVRDQSLLHATCAARAQGRPAERETDQKQEASSP